MILRKRNPGIAEYENNLKLKCNLKNARPVRENTCLFKYRNHEIKHFVYLSWSQENNGNETAASCLL